MGVLDKYNNSSYGGSNSGSSNSTKGILDKYREEKKEGIKPKVSSFKGLTPFKPLVEQIPNAKIDPILASMNKPKSTVVDTNIFRNNKVDSKQLAIDLNTQRNNKAIEPLKPKLNTLDNKTPFNNMVNSMGSTATGILDAGTFGLRESGILNAELPGEDRLQKEYSKSYWLGERIGEAINPIGRALNSIPIGKGLSLGKTMAMGGGINAGQGAIEEGVRSLVRGDDKKDVLKNTRDGAIGGFIGGAVFSGLGKGLSKLGNANPQLDDVAKAFSKNVDDIDLSDVSKPIKFGEAIERVKPFNDDIKPSKITENTPIKIQTPMKGKLQKSVEFKEMAEKWQDKPMLALKREIPERNFEDIMGKDAPNMIDKYLNPIHDNEALSTTFKNTERESIKKLGIKYNSKEDALIQKFGEKKITLDELKKELPKSWEKVVEGAEIFRNKYDEILNNINGVLKRNGYDPIPKRENYFPHMEEVEGLLKKFGMGMDNLPTDIAGLSADFKPGKNFFANALRRKGDKTKFSAIEGFDRYIEGASKLIYHTDDIKRLRNLEKTIRTEFAETNHLSNFVTDLVDYTNNLAGKKSMIDRGLENTVGRNIYSVVDKVRQRVASNMVGGNIGSALTNYIPLTQSLATTNKVSFVKGMSDTIANVLKDDGFIKESAFLTRRFGSDRLALNKIGKISKAANIPFELADNFVAQTIVRSKYLEGISQGLSKSVALKQADNWAARIMADRSLGATPTLFNSKTLAPLTQFQIEVNNQLSFMFKDMPKAFNKTKLASATTQLAIYSYLFNNLYEKAIGRRPAFDPIGTMLQAKDDYSKSDKKKATTNLIKNISDQLPFSSTFTGGRLPITASVPNLMDVASGQSTLQKELAKPLTYLALPTGGGQIKKTYTGLKALKDKGVYGKGANGKYLKYPVENNTTNKIKASLFGTNSFKETGEYYNNNRRPLSAQQTSKLKKEVAKGKNPQKLYNDLLKFRELTNKKQGIQNKIKVQKPNLKDYKPLYNRNSELIKLNRELKNKKYDWIN